MNLAKSFGPIWVGSGARGFFGEGYWFHFFLKPWLGALKRTVFVAKTTTAYYQKGNMLLTEDYQPRDLFPDCIHVDFFRGRMVNSVALSGPGIDPLLSTKRWQLFPDPFMISVMPVAKEEEDQKDEVRAIVQSLRQASLRDFVAYPHIALQANLACPNVGADMSKIEHKALWILDILQYAGRKILVKINTLVSPEAASRISKHPACAGLVVSNTAPFGEVLPLSYWNTAFKNGSPLVKYQGGGLSGKDLFPEVVRWLREFRKIDQTTYVNAGGGIMRKQDVHTLKAAGANSVSITSVIILRFWRIPGIVRAAYKAFE